MATGLLELPQDQFMGALNELGIVGAQRDDLIRQKRNQDSIFSGLFDFFAPQPGMERANILPMMRPEDMSGLEAITSGQAQFALPGMFTGALTGVAQAADAPRAAYAGQIPMQDMASEAGNVAGTLTLGGVGAAGRNLLDYDPTVARIFAGPRAATADKGALDRAKRLSASNVDRDAIWNETGWFKLPDGQWRFEIPDNDVGLRRPGETAQMAVDMRQQAKDIRAGIKQRNADLRVQPDLFPQTLRQAHGLLAREADTLESASGGNYGPEWSPDTLGQRATYALTDSELQRAYPELLFGTIVRNNQNLEGAYGSYDEGLKNLKLATDETFNKSKNPAYRDKRKTLVHELQHAVQGYENFSRGSNPESAGELLMNIREADIKAARNLQGELFKQASPEVKDLLSQRYYARERGDTAALDEANRMLQGLPLGADIIAADDAARAASGRIITNQDAFDAYERHLGELEARLAAERSGWSVGERKAIPPWWMGDYIPEDKMIKSFEMAPRYPKDIFSVTQQPQGLLTGPQ